MIFKKNPNIVARQTEHEYILVPLVDDIADMKEVYTLNEIGSLVFEMFDGKNDTEDIVKRIADEFDVTPDIARDELKAYINDLLSHNIITN